MIFIIRSNNPREGFNFIRKSGIILFCLIPASFFGISISIIDIKITAFSHAARTEVIVINHNDDPGTSAIRSNLSACSISHYLNIFSFLEITSSAEKYLSAFHKFFGYTRFSSASFH
jgi:hypothetical protein